MRQGLLTQYSEHANIIADTVRSAFAATKVGDLSVEMTAPTESTKGGLLSLQHVTLKGPGGQSIVAANVNPQEGSADIRSYSALSQHHQARFQKPLPFDSQAYDAFIDTLTSVLIAFGVTAKVVNDAPPSARIARQETPGPMPTAQASAKTVAAEEASSGPMWPKIMIAMVVALLVGGGVFWLIVR